MTSLNRRQLYSCGLLALMLVAVSTSQIQAQALDKVRTRNGLELGKITKITALGLTLTRSGVDKKLPVEEITNITYANEPEELTPAHRDTNAGRYAKALEKLGKIDSGRLSRSEITQEVEYLTTYCKAQLALSGQGSLAQARKQTASFLSKNNKSYHVPAAIELLGDLLLASRDYEGAKAQYTKLGKAPRPYFKAKSAILMGRTLQAEKKHQEAIDAFDRAITAAAGNAVAASQELEAKLLRAVSQAATGDLLSATETVKQIIKQTDAEDTLLRARAYNALGDCYLLANNKKEARQAFLRVDLMFNSHAAEHAKALYELTQLWEDHGKTARARDAKARLQENYPGSLWAQR